MTFDLTSIHASEVGSFRTCPFQWLCQNRGIARTEGMVTQRGKLGTLVHKVAEKYFKITRDKKMTNDLIARWISTTFEGMWAEQANSLGISRLKRRAKRNIDGFIKIEQNRYKTWEFYKPTHTERYLEYDMFCGTVDWYSEEARTIIDWKTTNTTFIREGMLIQGSIYKLLHEKNGFPVDRVYFALLYPGLLLQMPKTTIGWLEDKVSYMVNTVKSGKFPKKESGLCSVCEYKLPCELSHLCLWSV